MARFQQLFFLACMAGVALLVEGKGDLFMKEECKQVCKEECKDVPTEVCIDFAYEVEECKLVPKIVKKKVCPEKCGGSGSGSSGGGLLHGLMKGRKLQKFGGLFTSLCEKKCYEEDAIEEENVCKMVTKTDTKCTTVPKSVCTPKCEKVCTKKHMLEHAVSKLG